MAEEYFSNKGKENQRVHKSYISNSDIRNEIVYNKKTKTPVELIKFYRVCDQSIDALLNNYLWAANPLSFNDPFDCPVQLWNVDSFTLENMKRLIDPRAHFLFSNDNEANRTMFLKVRLASLGIVSLNEFQNDSQDTIWGYYTNQNGFSIKFDIHLLIKHWNVPFKIEYLDPDDLDTFHVNKITKEDLLPRFLRWSTQKKKVWETENEWRFIFSNLKIETTKLEAFSHERKKQYPSNAIKEIYLGLRFFPKENAIEDDKGILTFISDSAKHELHNKLLTFLSNNDEIKTNHIFFKEDLKLHPRPCEIYKTGENIFKIYYT